MLLYLSFFFPFWHNILFGAIFAIGMTRRIEFIKQLFIAFRATMLGIFYIVIITLQIYVLICLPIQALGLYFLTWPLILAAAYVWVYPDLRKIKLYLLLY